MKNLLNICFLFAALFATNLSAADCCYATESVQEMGRIILREGTPVHLELNEKITAAKKNIGHTVEFLVRNDVVVNGKVLIASGSSAFGKVTDVERTKACDCNACNDESSVLTIRVESVRAVNGTSVMLNSTPHTVTASCMDGIATVNIGTTVTSRVRNNSTIYL
ncbi:MAG: hypothetical protein AAF960_10860 [Bacteroidota bacterium]